MFEPDALRKTRITLTGRIVYIHPRGHYITVEFDTVPGKPRESFFPRDVKLID
jgi:hypothetical protein